MTEKVKIGQLLSRVQKPGRYIGGEVNQIVKPPLVHGVKFALCFPDVYEIGMSYPGLQILYTALNRLEWCAAERCFAVWNDMEKLMREGGIPLFTLESQEPLKSFDIAGFSIHHELSYTQILAMLDMAGIPLRSSERKDGDPFVIGGGPCALNPEPLAPFFDAFFLGDGEEGAVEIAAKVLEAKESRLERGEVLENLARINGVYVPSLYKVTYDGVHVSEFEAAPPAPQNVKRRVIPDIESAAYPVRHVVPNINPVHDRLVVEIQRGCARGCRFCHAGIIYRPVRQRSPEKILELAAKGLQFTGHGELSLLSLSAGDYPGLSGLLYELMSRHGTEKVSLSLPSLRVETLEPGLVEEIKKVRKTGFTIAPEAGSQRLRDVINKGVTEENFFSTIRSAFTAGWGLVKLYFMVGLPTETMEDVEAIAELCEKAIKEARAVNPKARFNVSVSTFVPKPHTPFQWEPMAPLDVIEKRLEYLKNRLARTKMNISTRPTGQCFVEAVLARGDRRLADAVEYAFRTGARLEAWHENFSYSRWLEAFKTTCEIPPGEFTGARNMSKRLAWEHLESGVSKDFLLGELDKALKGELTEDCVRGGCHDCGVCSAENGLKNVAAVELIRNRTPVRPAGNEEVRCDPSAMRIRYSRRGNAAYLGHLDIIALWIQALRRSALPVEYSRGFHPKMRISFGPACPVGIESSVEYLDVDLSRRVDPQRALSAISGFLGGCLKAEEAFLIPRNARSLSDDICEISYRFMFPAGYDMEAVRTHIKEFMSLGIKEVQRIKDEKVRIFDMRAPVLEARLEDAGTAFVRMSNVQSGSPRIGELLEHLFGLEEKARYDVAVERLAVMFS